MLNRCSTARVWPMRTNRRIDRVPRTASSQPIIGLGLFELLAAKLVENTRISLIFVAIAQQSCLS
jgi:hypothetical protein